MLTILLHSSKTMYAPRPSADYHAPQFAESAAELMRSLTSLSRDELEHTMKISASKATATQATLAKWNTRADEQTPAIDMFSGDIYSGLRAATLSEDDRHYANDHLRILSGLYGILKALDGISPYRLEMGYRLPDERYRNLYKFWGDQLAKTIPAGTLINLSSVEYTRALLPHLSHSTTVVTPQFLTRHPETHQPRFVAVHAKIARGAFARWLIITRHQNATITDFTDLGYHYDAAQSTDQQPVFVCTTFAGLGLSVRGQ